MRFQPLSLALCDRAKFLGFFSFVIFGHSFFGVGKLTFSAQILESLKPYNMPKFVKLPHKNCNWVRKTIRRKVWKGQVCGNPVFAEISAL